MDLGSEASDQPHPARRKKQRAYRKEGDQPRFAFRFKFDEPEKRESNLLF